MKKPTPHSCHVGRVPVIISNTDPFPVLVDQLWVLRKLNPQNERCAEDSKSEDLCVLGVDGSEKGG